MDDILKINRLSQWCDDINLVQSDVRYGWLYVDQEKFDKFKPKKFTELIRIFGS